MTWRAGASAAIVQLDLANGGADLGVTCGVRVTREGLVAVIPREVGRCVVDVLDCLLDECHAAWLYGCEIPKSIGYQVRLIL